MTELNFKVRYKMVTLFNCFSFNDEWYLVEMALSVPAKDIDFCKIVVPEEGIPQSGWQAPLAEQFLNHDGTERICKLYHTPENDNPDSRVAFFIYKTSSYTLRTPYGDFELSGAEDTPERLRSIIEVDDEYIVI